MEDKKLDDHLEDEQGFNDSELEDIMNEIESLESEFAEEINNETILEEKQFKGEDMSQHHDEKESEAQVVAIDHGSSSSKSSSSGPVALEFNVSGQMDMELKFNIGGQWVVVKVGEGQGLEVESESGAKFCLPMKKAS